ncbi:hypothetical protein D3874_08810 [Oleomonas cavernae]|uniref:Uncharacterized protein n=1 Tax=Oleomonas cavernae TaxID=2320859 RepID=A0A418WAN5_9PROT|nr:hypothetical protein D3874_08810 [Oleomonas cavernae]
MARRFYLLPVLAGVAALAIAVRLPQTLSTAGDFLPGTAKAIAAEPAPRRTMPRRTMQHRRCRHRPPLRQHRRRHRRRVSIPTP